MLRAVRCGEVLYVTVSGCRWTQLPEHSSHSLSTAWWRSSDALTLSRFHATPLIPTVWRHSHSPPSQLAWTKRSPDMKGKRKRTTKSKGSSSLTTNHTNSTQPTSTSTSSTTTTSSTSPPPPRSSASSKSKSRTTKTIKTSFQTDKRTAQSYPPLCSEDLLTRCRSLNHLVAHLKVPVEKSKSSALAARAAVQLAGEIRTVLSANAALFSSLWDSRERTGEEVIRTLHAKRMKNVQFLLRTYNAIVLDEETWTFTSTQSKQLKKYAHNSSIHLHIAQFSRSRKSIHGTYVYENKTAKVLEISEPSESTEEIFWREEYILQSPHRGSAVDWKLPGTRVDTSRTPIRRGWHALDQARYKRMD